MGICYPVYGQRSFVAAWTIPIITVTIPILTGAISIITLPIDKLYNSIMTKLLQADCSEEKW